LASAFGATSWQVFHKNSKTFDLRVVCIYINTTPSFTNMCAARDKQPWRPRKIGRNDLYPMHDGCAVLGGQRPTHAIVSGFASTYGGNEYETNRIL
jgi:hypothetical protein